MKSCCFFGHKNCTKEVKNTLLSTLERLILEQGVYTFYIGTQGGFDKLVYEVLCELEKKYEIQVVVVLAYLNQIIDEVYYAAEKTIFPDELTTVPPRFAIRRRNAFMIKRSDFVVAYLDTPFTNAFVNVEEAVRKKKHVINLGNYDVKKFLP